MTDRVAGRELDHLPVERVGHVPLDDAAVVGGQRVVDLGRDPEATGLLRARVDRDEE